MHTANFQIITISLDVYVFHIHKSNQMKMENIQKKQVAKSFQKQNLIML